MKNHLKTTAILAAAIAAPAPIAFAQLEEVIVTAQKREQGLQDVPIAVQAFSTENLESLAAQDIGDLNAFTPNVDIPRQTNQPNYKIRGLGTSEFGVGGDPVVGVYVDGVYIARGGGSKVAFSDIQRIEILNGPQGTLFGRNAAAGAIQYITNKPDEEQGGWVKATVGDYDRLQLEGVYNLPITDELFWRTGALYNEREGYIDNDYTGEDHQFQENWSISTALRWVPTDNLDIIWRLEYDEIDQDSKGVTSAIYGPNRFDGASFENTTTTRRLEETRELFGTSLHLVYDLPWATFTSITSYRTYETANPENQDGWIDPTFQFDDFNAEDNEQFSQEFRFSGDVGKLLWTAGANWYEETAKQTSAINLLPIAVERVIIEQNVGIPWGVVPVGTGYDIAWSVPDFANLPRAFDSGVEAVAADNYNESINVQGDYESWAVFADFTYDFTDRVSLTFGGRYTEDKKDFTRNVPVSDHGIFFAFTPTWVDENGNYVPDGSLDPTGLTIGKTQQDGEWDEFTPRVVLDWAVTDDVMMYASWAEGYNSGGFNSVGISNDADAYDPAKVDNLEFGFKSTWLDNTLRVNAAYFFYDFENLQELNQIPAACLPESDFAVHMFETSDVEGEGLELAINWAPLAGLELWGSLGTLDAEYSDRVRQREVNGVCDPIDETGDKFTGNPELAYALGANYTYDMSSGGALTGSVSWGWKEGETDRNNCTYIQHVSDDVSGYYELDTVEGALIISTDSAVGTLTEPPFDSCPDRDDREQLNTRLSYLSSQGNWEVAAWVTNWTDWGPDDEAGGSGHELSSPFTDGAPSYDRREPPRMYGMELKYMF